MGAVFRDFAIAEDHNPIGLQNGGEPLFFALLLLVVPLALNLMGLELARWLSVLPFYAWTSCW